jgi:membrane protease YdiL (CAAX protease family)
VQFAPLKKLLAFWATIAVSLVGYLFLLGLPVLGREGPFAGVIPVLCLAAAAYALNRGFLRSENRSMAVLGFDAPARRGGQLAIAFLGGCALVLGWAAIVAWVTGARWQPHPGFHLVGIVGLLGFAFFNNAAEELAYRSYAFLTLLETYGPAVAVVGTSVVFALLHLQAGVPLLSVVAGVLTTAFVFGVLFLRWRSVPLVLGFHLATNVMQELIGLRLSGASILEPVYPASVNVAQAHTALMLTGALNTLAALGLAWGHHAGPRPTGARTKSGDENAHDLPQ